MKELKIEAKLENITAVIDFVNAELEAMDCPMKVLTQIDIAVDEIFSNIANYAYAPENGMANIAIAVVDNTRCIQICFEDSGIEYNPLNNDDPNIDLPLEERQIGGLGIFLTKKLTDDIRYERIDGKNILTIEKKF